MKSQRHQLRSNLAAACENYWQSITSGGWSDSYAADRRSDVAKHALRLHIFEQGRRAAMSKKGGGA